MSRCVAIDNLTIRSNSRRSETINSEEWPQVLGVTAFVNYLMFGTYRTKAKTIDFNEDGFKLTKVVPNIETKFKYHIMIPFIEIQELLYCIDPSLPMILIKPMKESNDKIQECMCLGKGSTNGFKFDIESNDFTEQNIIIILKEKINEKLISILEKSLKNKNPDIVCSKLNISRAQLYLHLVENRYEQTILSANSRLPSIEGKQPNPFAINAVRTGISNKLTTHTNINEGVNQSQKPINAFYKHVMSSNHCNDVCLKQQTSIFAPKYINNNPQVLCQNQNNLKVEQLKCQSCGLMVSPVSNSCGHCRRPLNENRLVDNHDKFYSIINRISLTTSNVTIAVTNSANNMKSESKSGSFRPSLPIVCSSHVNPNQQNKIRKSTKGIQLYYNSNDVMFGTFQVYVKQLLFTLNYIKLIDVNKNTNETRLKCELIIPLNEITKLLYSSHNSQTSLFILTKESINKRIENYLNVGNNYPNKMKFDVSSEDKRENNIIIEFNDKHYLSFIEYLKYISTIDGLNIDLHEMSPENAQHLIECTKTQNKWIRNEIKVEVLETKLKVMEKEKIKLLNDCDSLRRKWQECEDNDSFCAICLEKKNTILSNGIKMVSTNCGHVFCKVCLNNALKARKVCPTCIKPLRKGTYHELYL